MADESWVPLHIEHHEPTGNEINITVPDNRIYSIFTIQCLYIANAVGSNRLIEVKFELQSEILSALATTSEYPSTVEQAVSTRHIYNWEVGGVQEYAFNTNHERFGQSHPLINLSMGGAKILGPGSVISMLDVNDNSSASGETPELQISGVQMLYVPKQGGVGDDFSSDMIGFGSS